jgi:hypothetical protein
VIALPLAEFWVLNLKQVPKEGTLDGALAEDGVGDREGGMTPPLLPLVPPPT